MALSIATLAVHGVWLTHTYPGSPALPERDPAPDNRWQRSDVIDALYLAERKATVWAEWYLHLADCMVPPSQQMPRELWRWQIDIEVADLSTPARLAAAGLQPPVPDRRTWPSFQEVGEQIWQDGWAGLLAPSAARPAGRILCLFRKGQVLCGVKPLAPGVITEPPPPPCRTRPSGAGVATVDSAGDQTWKD